MVLTFGLLYDLEILRDRGYEINDGDINQSIEDFKSDYETKPSQNFIAKREMHL